jgi:hypothetical protein
LLGKVRFFMSPHREGHPQVLIIAQLLQEIAGTGLGGEEHVVASHLVAPTPAGSKR